MIRLLLGAQRGIEPSGCSPHFDGSLSASQFLAPPSVPSNPLQTSRSRAAGTRSSQLRLPDSARCSGCGNPAASAGAAATPYLPTRGRAGRRPPRARERSLPPSSALPRPRSPVWAAGRGGGPAGAAEEEGGAAFGRVIGAPWRTWGAGGDSHTGGDGVAQSETGD